MSVQNVDHSATLLEKDSVTPHGSREQSLPTYENLPPYISLFAFIRVKFSSWKEPSA